MTAFSKKQPTRGENVMLCTHSLGDNKPSPLHWFYFDNAAVFVRPHDSSIGESHWLAVCPECFVLFQMGTPLEQLPIGADEVWLGDEPAILKPEMS